MTYIYYVGAGKCYPQMDNVSMMLPMMMLNKESTWLSIIILFMTSLMSIFAKSSGIRHIKDIILSGSKRKIAYKLSCSITYKNKVFYEVNYSAQFRPVMVYLYKKITEDKKNKIKYEIIDEPEIDIRIINLHTTLFSKPYELVDGIYIMQDIEVDSFSKEDYSFKSYTLNILSHDNNSQSIIQFLNKVSEEYEVEQQGLRNSKLRVFQLDEILTHAGRLCPTYTETVFDTTKTFDNMFFKEKETLLNCVDLFQNKNTERYSRLGIPKTLGMMFHGEPGTGKTSAIKALAKYTNRHIFIIPLRLINTLPKLQKIFLDEYVNNVKIPRYRRLYVFEEIDCSSWKNLVTNRKIIMEPQYDNKSSIDDFTVCLKTILSKENKENAKGDDKKKNNKRFNEKEEVELTLGDILEVLDGMIEMPDRMIVMTSNHPEDLDPALLRPGRIDLRICFSKMRMVDIKDMYKLWFDIDMPEECYSKIKDYTFSQAEIGNLFSTYDMKLIMDTLTNQLSCI